jgi:hypothetical protein
MIDLGYFLFSLSGQSKNISPLRIKIFFYIGGKKLPFVIEKRNLNRVSNRSY